MVPVLFGEFVETGPVTPARMRVIDANAMALGVTELQLMESAGRALAEQVLHVGAEHRGVDPVALHLAADEERAAAPRDVPEADTLLLLGSGLGGLATWVGWHMTARIMRERGPTPSRRWYSPARLAHKT